MLASSLAPYLLWAKTRTPAAIDLAGSNLWPCTLEDLPGAREAVDLAAPNDNGYRPILESIAAHYGISVDRVASANGCSGANFISIAALVGAGDHVLIERPLYDPLIGACRLLGADIERFDRTFEDGFCIDVEDVARRLRPRTRLIVVTSPHNPTGVQIDTDTLIRLARLAEESGGHLLVDEVYLDAVSRLRGEPPTSRSAATLDGPIVVTSSLTKSYGLAGLRCGWAIATPGVAERIRRTRDVVDNAAPGPSDRLAALAFQHLPQLAERARRLLAGNVALARAFFEQRSALQVVEPPCSSVVFPRLRGIADSAPFVARLLETQGVAVAPGHFFEAPAHFRVSLAGNPDAFASGVARLGSALDAL